MLLSPDALMGLFRRGRMRKERYDHSIGPKGWVSGDNAGWKRRSPDDMARSLPKAAAPHMKPAASEHAPGPAKDELKPGVAKDERTWKQKSPDELQSNRKKTQIAPSEPAAPPAAAAAAPSIPTEPPPGSVEPAAPPHPDEIAKMDDGQIAKLLEEPKAAPSAAPPAATPESGGFRGKSPDELAKTLPKKAGKISEKEADTIVSDAAKDGRFQKWIREAVSGSARGGDPEDAESDAGLAIANAVQSLTPQEATNPNVIEAKVRAAIGNAKISTHRKETSQKRDKGRTKPMQEGFDAAAPGRQGSSNEEIASALAGIKNPIHKRIAEGMLSEESLNDIRKELGMSRRAIDAESEKVKEYLGGILTPYQMEGIKTRYERSPLRPDVWQEILKQARTYGPNGPEFVRAVMEQMQGADSQWEAIQKGRQAFLTHGSQRYAHEKYMNENHAPAGSPEGGQFTGKSEHGQSPDDMAAKLSGKKSSSEKSSVGKAVDAAKGTYDAIHELGSGVFHSLPGPVQKAINMTLKVAFVGWTATQSVAERIAVEKGSTPEQAAKIRGILAAWDIVAFKPTAIATAPLGGAVAAATWIVPPVTGAYILTSTVVNPMATFRAASGIVKDIYNKTHQEL